MDIIINIIVGIFYIGLGSVILKYRKTVKHWTGSFGWAEQHIGRGGTYLILILIGIGLIFYGSIYPFGGIDILINK